MKADNWKGKKSKLGRAKRLAFATLLFLCTVSFASGVSASDWFNNADLNKLSEPCYKSFYRISSRASRDEHNYAVDALMRHASDTVIGMELTEDNYVYEMNQEATEFTRFDLDFTGPSDHGLRVRIDPGLLNNREVENFNLAETLENYEYRYGPPVSSETLRIIYINDEGNIRRADTYSNYEGQSLFRRALNFIEPGAASMMDIADAVHDTGPSNYRKQTDEWFNHPMLYPAHTRHGSYSRNVTTEYENHNPAPGEHYMWRTRRCEYCYNTGDIDDKFYRSFQDPLPEVLVPIRGVRRTLGETSDFAPTFEGSWLLRLRAERLWNDMQEAIYNSYLLNADIIEEALRETGRDIGEMTLETMSWLAEQAFQNIDYSPGDSLVFEDFSGPGEDIYRSEMIAEEINEQLSAEDLLCDKPDRKDDIIDLWSAQDRVRQLDRELSYLVATDEEDAGRQDGDVDALLQALEEAREERQQVLLDSELNEFEVLAFTEPGILTETIEGEEIALPVEDEGSSGQYRVEIEELGLIHILALRYKVVITADADAPPTSINISINNGSFPGWSTRILSPGESISWWVSAFPGGNRVVLTSRATDDSWTFLLPGPDAEVTEGEVEEPATRESAELISVDHINNRVVGQIPAELMDGRQWRVKNKVTYRYLSDDIGQISGFAMFKITEDGFVPQSRYHNTGEPCFNYYLDYPNLYLATDLAAAERSRGRPRADQVVVRLTHNPGADYWEGHFQQVQLRSGESRLSGLSKAVPNTSPGWLDDDQW